MPSARAKPTTSIAPTIPAATDPACKNLKGNKVAQCARQTSTRMINVHPEISISRVRTLATKRKSGSVLARVKSGLIRPARENSQAEDIYRTFQLRLHVKIINLKSADTVAALLPRQLGLAGRFSL
jgi:hypothetical protein